MADKEATVYIVDVGKSMGNFNQGRRQTDLQCAMTYMWDKITSIVAMERKTTFQAIIGLKTDDTSNELSQDESFQKISVWQDLSALSLADLKRLQHHIRPSATDRGDAISAIVIAIQLITKKCKKLKFKRKIVLVTNGRGYMDGDDIAAITDKLAEDDIELVVLGVDFDDPEYGFKEEGKSSRKAENEALLKDLTERCDGSFGTLAEAIGELGMPRLKYTRPVASFKDQLMLGEPEDYDTAMVIDIDRFPRTSVRKPPTASSYVQRDTTTGPISGDTSSTMLADTDIDMLMGDSNNLSAVRQARKYEVADETGIGGKREVPFEDLAKGYEYGSTAVYVSESDMVLKNMETKARLEIIGFIPFNSYHQFMGLTKTNVIIGRKGNTKASMAISSLAHALQELESYAIARLVIKSDKAPILVLLAPLVEADYECLIDVEIPFAEDVRSYKFPPLDRVITVSGKTIKEHRNLPDEKLMNAMSDYVDQMDLSTFSKDDDGNPEEYLTLTDAFSPILHRTDQAIRFRAISSIEPIPPPAEILTRYSKPPQELADATKAHLDKLIAASNVKKVPPKSQSRRQKGNQAKPVSGLDVASLLSKTPQLKVDPSDPISTFNRMLDHTQDPDGITKAATQLGAIIENKVKESFGDGLYPQAIEEMHTLKKGMVELEEPDLWNDWVKGLKEKLLAEQLGGDRKEFWWQIKKERLGLYVGDLSKVTEEDAKAFLAQNT